jgi:hypothetical protein
MFALNHRCGCHVSCNDTVRNIYLLPIPFCPGHILTNR